MKKQKKKYYKQYIDNMEKNLLYNQNNKTQL